MNINIANSLSGYIETLYYLNKKFLQLCGTDIIYDSALLREIRKVMCQY